MIHATHQIPYPLLTPLTFMNRGASVLSTVAHPHRLRMLQLLLQGKYTVGELAVACDITSPVATEHLRVMQRRGLLTREKQGRCVYYRIADSFLTILLAIMDDWFRGISSARRDRIGCSCRIVSRNR